MKNNKKKSDNRVGQMSTVSRNEWNDAIKVATFWLTKKLKGRTERGPFSEAALGEPARLYFIKRAYMALWSGDWKWKPGLKLSTQLIRIIKSDLSHTHRDWCKYDEPEKVSLDECLVEPVDEVKVRIELETEMKEESKMKQLAYEIAARVVGAEQELHTYLRLVKEQMSYREIALKMKIRMAQVKELEERLLKMLKERKDEVFKEIIYEKNKMRYDECVRLY